MHCAFTCVPKEKKFLFNISSATTSNLDKKNNCRGLFDGAISLGVPAFEANVCFVCTNKPNSMFLGHFLQLTFSCAALLYGCAPKVILAVCVNSKI